ncbi:TRAP transporter large permease subunit, partial [Oceanicola sp. S124]|uniref:TRAP transporter large permease subunit n=1 Tax=Oceanicola sp. S124 TaxID=1042378 RepID=UPI000255899B
RAAVLIVGTVVLGQVGLVGSQDLSVSNFAQGGEGAILRTNVSETCQAAMIELHGQAKWDTALEQTRAIMAAGGVEQGHELSAEEIEAAIAAKASAAAPVGSGIATIIVLLGLVLAAARGVRPADDPRPLLIGGGALALVALLDVLFIAPTTSPGVSLLIIALPLAAALWACRHAAARLATNELIRVVFPPLVLIVAVLGSILGGITNPTPAAALGAGGAILLAAFRKLKDEGRDPWVITWSTLALIVMILLGANFDLRVNQTVVTVESWLAYLAAAICFMFAGFGLIYAGWVLLRTSVLGKIVRETAKVTSMVFTILVGSQLLNLVVISFGGEHYIQQFLKSFDSEFQVFLIVMLVLFVLGFVLDFLEIIYIVIPIVGPVIYGGTFDPKWVTIMIAVNLQTSFLTPPFGFALFYLRGVAPASVTTGHIYRGIVPFVLIQVLGLALLWFVPGIVTIVPDLLGR